MFSMRLIKSFTCLVLFIGLIACKQGERIQKDIEGLKSRPIDLCLEKLPCYINGHDTIYTERENVIYKWVIYIGPSACTSCFVTHMIDYEMISPKMQAYDVDIIFVFDFIKNEHEDLSSLIRLSAYPYWCIIDEESLFREQNPHIPSNPLLHSFLLDEKDSVILVGNPVRNKKIEELFFKILEERKDKQDKK